jgi:DNA-binding GntR family transcriptional regulator
VIRIEDYVFDVLMRDLVGHDHSPSAYLVYVHLWSQTIGRRAKSARLSHKMVASATGLSKSAVQAGMRQLVRRRLVSVHRESATATPEYRVLRPWVKVNSAKVKE